MLIILVEMNKRPRLHTIILMRSRSQVGKARHSSNPAPRHARLSHSRLPVSPRDFERVYIKQTSIQTRIPRIKSPTHSH
ncbi:hypothetical protein BJY01DRAFT_229611 [Aspergillus pseudoustus]|uniref:Uncharacterized protein n=1 Tax=Aspergillus pseudoustus TaxID=1810923 RepID=A0ABR4IFS4_9EURO